MYKRKYKIYQNYFKNLTKNDSNFNFFIFRCLLFQQITDYKTKTFYLKKIKEFEELNHNSKVSKLLFFYYLTETDNDIQLKFWNFKSNIQQLDLQNYYQNYD